MTRGEVRELLEASQKAQIATINPDGRPHLVTMFYCLIDGRMAFWTYRKSQKARNIARDTRVTCLVEDGTEYGELRGAMIYGTAKAVDQHAAIADIGAQVATRTMGVAASASGSSVQQQARKRIAYIVEPERVVTWDHRKLS